MISTSSTSNMPMCSLLQQQLCLAGVTTCLPRCGNDTPSLHQDILATQCINQHAIHATPKQLQVWATRQAAACETTPNQPRVGNSHATAWAEDQPADAETAESNTLLLRWQVCNVCMRGNSYVILLLKPRRDRNVLPHQSPPRGILLRFTYQHSIHVWRDQRRQG